MLNKNRPRTRRLLAGQSMVEYLVIVALVAVAAIGVYQFFGQTVRSQTAGIAMEVSGQSASTSIQNAQQAATQAEGQGNTQKTLGSYQAN